MESILRNENPVEHHSITDIKNSFLDAVFANIFATLTGGVFLTGLAVYLGMRSLFRFNYLLPVRQNNPGRSPPFTMSL